MVSNVGIATLLVGLPASCHSLLEAFLAWLGVLSRRRGARRRFASVIFYFFSGSFSLPMAYSFGVVTTVVECASRRSVSVCVYHLDAPLGLIWN
jgi:hypothetical protein